MKDIKFKLVFVWSMLINVTINGQAITLDEVWQKTADNYPVNIRSLNLIEESTQQKLKNIKSNWFPQFELAAQATWQNDVTHVGFVPNMPMAPKDQYKIGVEISQTIYDGRQSRARSQQESANESIEKQNIEVQLLSVKLLITDLFFTLLQLDDQIKQINFVIEDINARLKELSAAVAAGVVLETEKQILELEKLKLDKHKIGITENQKSLFKSLSLFTGLAVSDNDSLTYPDETKLFEPLLRPEYGLFKYQKNKIEADRNLNSVAIRPVVAAFSQVGYGNPAFNMFKNEFDNYVLVGIKLRWKPWDWGTSRRNSHILNNQVELVDLRQKAFELEQDRATLQLESEISAYTQKMKKDEEIVKMQMVIVENYRTRLKSGTITAAEYITVLNGNARARLDLQLTRLNYLHTLTKKYLTSGN